MIPFTEPRAALQAAMQRSSSHSQQMMSLLANYATPMNLSEEESFDLRFHGVGVCQIASGQVIVVGHDKPLFILEAGDVFFVSDFLDEKSDLHLQWESAVSFQCVTEKDIGFLNQSDANFAQSYEQWQQKFRLWLLILLAHHVAPAQQPKTGFLRVEDGKDIVVEGDDAPFVYTLLEGHAEVFTNNVKVGDITTDEIFGAMAALADTKRTATVRAKGSCLVMMVSKEEFYLLVNSHPHLFINLLKDMARVIVALNEQVVTLKGR